MFPSYCLSSRPFPQDIASRTNSNRVHTSNHTKSASQSNISVKPIGAGKSFTRSLTQEMNVEEISLAKAAASEGNLELAKARPAVIPEKTCLPKKAISIEDDICSTDSSLIEEGEVKKKRRKLFTFSKKSKKGEKS